MNESLRKALWKQFGAAIDMLQNAISECPDELWDTTSKFWYKAYHTLFFLDYYLTLNPEGFSPPPPFTHSELDPSGILPDRVYGKDELLAYLKLSRTKCFSLITNLTSAHAERRWVNEYRNYTTFEILLYNMRHVQHHAAQLNLLLRQGIDQAPGWVSEAKMKG